jgi:hypothetical protein
MTKNIKLGQKVIKLETRIGNFSFIIWKLNLIFFPHKYYQRIKPPNNGLDVVILCGEKASKNDVLFMTRLYGIQCSHYRISRSNKVVKF